MRFFTALALFVLTAAPLAAQEKLVAPKGVRLTLAGAEYAMDAAQKKAEEMRLKVCITIVDDGGHLLHFSRMDGARPGSAYTALTKAQTAALIRGETGPRPSEENPDIHLSLSLEGSAAVNGGKFTTLKGGVPIVVDGEVIGALGVGGATGEQDREIARAAAKALVEAVQSGAAR
jgi:glc operon protein GlcG